MILWTPLWGPLGSVGPGVMSVFFLTAFVVKAVELCLYCYLNLTTQVKLLPLELVLKTILFFILYFY